MPEVLNLCTGSIVNVLTLLVTVDELEVVFEKRSAESVVVVGISSVDEIDDERTVHDV